MDLSTALAWLFGTYTLIFGGFTFYLYREWGKALVFHEEILDSGHETNENALAIVEINAQLFEKVYGISLKDAIAQAKETGNA